MKKKLFIFSSLSLLCLGGLIGCNKEPHKHDFSHLIDKVDSDCVNEGMEAHYECGCGKYFNISKEEVDPLQLTILPKGHSYQGKDYSITLTNHEIQCNRCDHVETSEHSLQKHNKVDATCTKEGKLAYFECSTCHCIIDENKTHLINDMDELIIPAKGHFKGNLIPTKNPTCTEDGVKAHYECINCDQLFNDQGVECTASDLKIEKLNHDFTGSETYFDKDYHWLECQREGCNYHQNEAHNFNFVSKVFPTCTNTGLEEHYICNDCGVIVNSSKTALTTLEALKIPATGHNPDTSHWEYDGENHWHNCLNSGCVEKLDCSSHTGVGYKNVINTTNSLSGSFEINCDICNGSHTHNYDGKAIVNFSNDYSKATFTFTCASCDVGAPDHTFSITVSTIKQTIEKGRISPGGYRYTASVTFLGNQYSETYDDIADPYNWIPGSSGSDVAEIDRNSDNNNIILNAVLSDGDTTFKLEEQYDETHNMVNATMMQIQLKVLSCNNNSSIWWVNQSGTTSGKTKLEVDDLITVFYRVGSELIFRNGLKVEVQDIYYFDPYLIYSDDATHVNTFGIYHSLRDEDGYIKEFNYYTDGVNDFDKKVGFSSNYMKKLYEEGFRTLSFNLSRAGGDLARLHNPNAKGEDVVSYPNNGLVTVNINGEQPVYIDACADGGVPAQTFIELTNIKPQSVKDAARSKLALKFENKETAWSYIHHGCSDTSVSADGSTYFLNNKGNFTLTNHFICLMREAGYRYLQLRVKAYEPDSGSIAQVGFVTGDHGGSWDTYWSYPEGNEATFCLDLNKWPAQLEDTADHFVAQFFGRTSGGVNLSCKFEIEIKNYYEDSQITLLNSTPKLYGVFEEASTKGIYIRFKYLNGKNTRAPIWGNSSSHIIDAPAFNNCTSLANVKGYGDGWYEFYLNQFKILKDGELYLSADNEANTLIDVSYESANK